MKNLAIKPEITNKSKVYKKNSNNKIIGHEGPIIQVLP